MDELRDPQMVRLGHISKKVNDKRYVVRVKPDGTHYWDEAKREDIQCSRYLQRKIKKLMKEVGRKTVGRRVQTKEQAVAIAYNMTSEKFPTCGLTSQAPKALGSISKKRKAVSSKKASKQSVAVVEAPAKKTAAKKKKSTAKKSVAAAPKKKATKKKKSVLDTLKEML